MSTMVRCGECGEPKHWLTQYEKAAFEDYESQCIDCDRLRSRLIDAVYGLELKRRKEAANAEKAHY